MRALLSGFCFCLFGIGSLLIGTIVFPLIILCTSPEKTQYYLAAIVHHMWRLFVAIMQFFRLIHIDIKDKNIKKLKNSIIVANHPTLIDIVILIALIPNSICIVKEKLATNFFMKYIIRRLYLVNNADPEIFFQQATAALHKGMNIIIFPEGTRTTPGQLSTRLHRGFAHLAIRSNTPIVPIHITVSPLILSKNQHWYQMNDRPAHYTLTCLPKLQTTPSATISPHTQAQQIAEKIRLQLFQIKG